MRARFVGRVACCLTIALGAGIPAAATAQQAMFEADAIPAPLTASPGDPLRGRAVLIEREKGHCVLCHALPDPGIRFAGNVGPPLAGVGLRLSASQLRGRIADPGRHNPETAMPAYYRTENLRRVDRRYAGRTVLGAQDIEDVIAYLLTLR